MVQAKSPPRLANAGLSVTGCEQTSMAPLASVSSSVVLAVISTTRPLIVGMCFLIRVQIAGKASVAKQPGSQGRPADRH
jgi:hypothetical protein